MAYLVLGAASLGLIAIAAYVCLRAFLKVGGRFNIGSPANAKDSTSGPLGGPSDRIQGTPSSGGTVSP
jgi:hypothetical protein